MPTLRIPETYNLGLSKLASLDAVQIEKLKLALKHVAPKLKAAEIAGEIQNNAPTLADTQEMIQVLTSLSGTFGVHEDLDIDEFVGDVIGAMQKSSGVFNQPTAGWASFGSCLKHLLSTRTIRMSARADDVQHEESNVFTTARILTDIRPVFEPDTAVPSGALIIHNLKITYFHDGDYSDIYISMDNADLKRLRAVLDRAEKKTSGLKAAIEKADLLYFQAE